MHHLNKTLILKSKLNCAIWSSKTCFYKCSLYPGRHGDGDTIDFQGPDRLFLVTLVNGVCLAWKGEHCLATVAMHPCSCLLPMPALSVKCWSSAHKLHLHQHSHGDFHFPVAPRGMNTSSSPRLTLTDTIASTAGSRSGSLVRWVESPVSSTCTHVPVATQIY